MSVEINCLNETYLAHIKAIQDHSENLRQMMLSADAKQEKSYEHCKGQLEALMVLLNEITQRVCTVEDYVIPKRRAERKKAGRTTSRTQERKKG